MGDGRVKDKAPDVQSPPQDDLNSLLRESAYDSMRRAGSDKVADASGGGAARKYDDPYQHLGQAGLAKRELARYMEIDSLKDQDSNKKVTVDNKQTTIGELRQELKQAFERDFQVAVDKVDPEALFNRAHQEFKAAMDAADRINQPGVTSTLWQTRTDLGNKQAEQKQASDLNELLRLNEEEKALHKQETTLEGMRYSPSNARAAYAEFLAQTGNLLDAKRYMDQAAKLDHEASLDPEFKKMATSIDQALKAGLDKGAQDKLALADDPIASLQQADQKRKSGDVTGADAAYRKAVEQADKLNPELIQGELASIHKAQHENAGNAQKLAELKAQETRWSYLEHGQAIARLSYADFLSEQKRYAEAGPLLDKVAKDDPSMLQGDPAARQLVGKVYDWGQKAATDSFDNPFDHLNKFKEAYDKGDLEAARKELKASVDASDKIDTKAMAERRKAIEDQIEHTTDANKKDELQKTAKFLEAMEHCQFTTRMALGRFELADKNYNSAKELFTKAGDLDKAEAAKPENKMKELLEASNEPSTWGKIWHYTKSILKELACDAVAILAGAGAVVLTGWSGPGAVVAGAAAGAAAYTAMKGLMGVGERMYDGQDFGSAVKGTWKDDLHWYTPVFGAVDGISGGTAALARSAIMKAGGKMIAQETMEAGIKATTKDVALQSQKIAALEGLEGAEKLKVAQSLYKEGLKDMGKELSLWTRFKSHIPLLPTGDAAYRTALAAGRTYTAFNVAADMGTAASMSLLYRTKHEAENYYSGRSENKTFGDFAKSYALGVTSDTLSGGLLGAIGRGVGDHLTSGILGKATQGIRTGMPGLGTKLDSMFVIGAPVGELAANKYAFLTQKVEPTLQYMQAGPLDPKKNKQELWNRNMALDYAMSQPPTETPSSIKESVHDWLKSPTTSTGFLGGVAERWTAPDAPPPVKEVLEPEIDSKGKVIKPEEDSDQPSDESSPGNAKTK